jgi:hypothetical protein
MGVPNIRFSAGKLFDKKRINQLQVKTVTEDTPNGYPVFEALCLK